LLITINHRSNMDLDSMKYADLRSLAKELGLKANGKVRKLLLRVFNSQCCRGLTSLKRPLVVFNST
uniref:SAP domain-containing protein n=1 Tax=Nothobranchius furzeri TaxID=105023 RepID=A0A8C6L3V9_NOTFU